LALHKYARIVQKLSFDAKFSEFKIQNIVGSCGVKFPIRSEGLVYSHGHRQLSSYKSEVRHPSSCAPEVRLIRTVFQRFPGLIYCGIQQSHGREAEFRNMPCEWFFDPTGTALTRRVIPALGTHGNEAHILTDLCHCYLQAGSQTLGPADK
jgi:hypothetical protein